MVVDFLFLCVFWTLKCFSGKKDDPVLKPWRRLSWPTPVLEAVTLLVLLWSCPELLWGLWACNSLGSFLGSDNPPRVSREQWYILPGRFWPDGLGQGKLALRLCAGESTTGRTRTAGKRWLGPKHLFLRPDTRALWKRTQPAAGEQLPAMPQHYQNLWAGHMS